MARSRRSSVPWDVDRELIPASRPPTAIDRPTVDNDERQRRQVTDLVDHTQRLLRLSDHVREEFFWSQLTPKPHQRLGQGLQQLPQTTSTRKSSAAPHGHHRPQPRSRKIEDRPKFSVYEIALDVWPDVFAWGYLLLPNNLKPRANADPSWSASTASKVSPPIQSAAPGTRILRLQILRRPPRRPRVHRVRPAQPVSRRRSLPRPPAKGESPQEKPLLRDHRPARPHPRLARGSTVCRPATASASMA
jgi:hypothetical protein